MVIMKKNLNIPAIILVVSFNESLSYVTKTNPPSCFLNANRKEKDIDCIW